VITNLRSNIWKLRAYWFFHSLIFAYVIERVFAQSRGLSVQDMVSVEIVYAVATLVLEVPTGALADRWSRKYTLILSSVFVILEFFVLIFAHQLWLFWLSAVMAACGVALASGTANAFLYDSLQALEESETFEQQLGRIGVGESVAGLIGALGGAWVADRWGLTWPYGLSLVGTVMALGIGLSLREPPRSGYQDEDEPPAGNSWQHMQQAFHFLRVRPLLLRAVAYATVIGAMFVYVDEYVQLYLQSVGVPLVLFGVWYAVYMVGEASFRALSWRLKRYGFKAWGYLALGAAGGLSLAAMMPTFWGLIPLLGAFACMWMSQPLTTGYLHHQTPSSHRATVESCANLLTSLVSVGVGLTFGAIATHFDIFVGYRYLAVLLLGGSLVWLLWPQTKERST
jgi:predicted MFS family arabinose efflux permease